MAVILIRAVKNWRFTNLYDKHYQTKNYGYYILICLSGILFSNKDKSNEYWLCTCLSWLLTYVVIIESSKKLQLLYTFMYHHYSNQLTYRKWKSKCWIKIIATYILKKKLSHLESHPLEVEAFVWTLTHEIDWNWVFQGVQFGLF